MDAYSSLHLERYCQLCFAQGLSIEDMKRKKWLRWLKSRGTWMWIKSHLPARYWWLRTCSSPINYFHPLYLTNQLSHSPLYINNYVRITISYFWFILSRAYETNVMKHFKSFQGTFVKKWSKINFLRDLFVIMFWFYCNFNYLCFLNKNKCFTANTK